MSPAAFPDHAARIQSLHDTYCRATGFQVALNYVRLRAWHEWLKWGADSGEWTEADLALVIGYLRKKISQGDRNPGALKFRNLIEQPDTFEEDLNLARSESRIRARETSTPRPLPAGWQAYLRENYPDNPIPRDPAQLPDYIQREIRTALKS